MLCRRRHLAVWRFGTLLSFVSPLPPVRCWLRPCVKSICFTPYKILAAFSKDCQELLNYLYGICSLSSTNSFVDQFGNPRNDTPCTQITSNSHFSSSLASHRRLVENSKSQKPDTVLRKRTRQGHLMDNGYGVSHHSESGVHKTESGNPIVKVAVWTLAFSMGAMTFLVLNASKKWI